MKPDTSNILMKTVVFQNQNTSNSQNLEIQIECGQDTNTVIKNIIHIWKNKNKNNLQKTTYLKIYDPEINRYTRFDIQKPLSNSLIYSPVIMIKFKESQCLPHLEEQGLSLSPSIASTSSRKDRHAERTIRQVIEYVKQWRQIHNTLNKDNVKINLQEAAKIVGISKKSLDDYYYQLRLAELYRFDFEHNMKNKIGTLRSFVKQHRFQQDQSIKHDKLPKKLRIFQLVQSRIVSSKVVADQQLKMQQQPPIQNIIETEYDLPLPIIPQDQYEDRFYNTFNFNLNEPDDPVMFFTMKNSLSQNGSYSDFPLL